MKDFDYAFTIECTRGDANLEKALIELSKNGIRNIKREDGIATIFCNKEDSEEYESKIRTASFIWSQRTGARYIMGKGPIQEI
jgi:hypothetical protein